ncbi:hypothetical protein [Rhizobium sp. P44RR-XXIV]|uniref:hypothetical protein n=1 Tax=Rhizobium sp. P44RR-XXIV TaxID=1921145 RepID=UPI0010AB0A0D|nr:hypothetical protein [Rhizobium sp. P44RR-XXIV]TIX91256.1 hypothetical protein BSK43_009780 [Rhizobium sp. P44RR-XXIV]
MNDPSSLRHAIVMVESNETADFLSLNFILEMQSVLDNHSKIKGNSRAGFSNRLVSSAPGSKGKFLVSSAAA